MKIKHINEEDSRIGNFEVVLVNKKVCGVKKSRMHKIC